MSRRFPLLAVAVVLASVVWCAAPSSGQEQGAKTLTAEQAAEHVGEVATVAEVRRHSRGSAATGDVE